MNLNIAIGGDHAGFSHKEKLIVFLRNAGHHVKDFGTYTSESADYADFAHPVASAIEAGEFNYGVLVCGSGNGVCMTANKHQGIRAALCWNEQLATLARQHNNANIICLPERFTEYQLAEKMVGIFISTAFEGGRHERRTSKISC